MALGLAGELREDLRRISVSLLISLGVFVIGLSIGAVLMVIFGYNPLKAYRSLFYGALLGRGGLAESISLSIPLMLSGLTFAISAKAGLFNIGAEGQIYLGAIGAVIAGAYLSLPFPLHLIVTTLFAMLLGVAWSLGPALLKAHRGVNEVITTIMFNWIATYLVMYLALNVFYDPQRAERTVTVLPTARYPQLVEFSSLTTAIFAALLLCIVFYVILFKTKIGYELRVYGLNPDAAKYGGISSKKVVLYSFILGGMAAGLAGGLLITGRPPTFALYGTLGNVSGYGFDGIGVALIGRNHPIGIILSAFLIALLRNGGRYMEFQAGVYSELVRAIIGIIVIALAIPEIYEMVARYMRIRRARRMIEQ
jgi:simple sugar transport system permease protein